MKVTNNDTTSSFTFHLMMKVGLAILVVISYINSFTRPDPKPLAKERVQQLPPPPPQERHHIVKSNKVLGQGVSSTVYKAMMGKTPVAIKVHKHLSGEYTRIEKLKKTVLNSPYLEPRALKLGRTKSGRDYAIFPLMTPADKHTFSSHKALIRGITDIARGIFFLHQQGLVHRDIRPPNILVDSHERMYLSDCEFVIPQDDTAEHGKLSDDMLQLGTSIPGLKPLKFHKPALQQLVRDLLSPSNRPTITQVLQRLPSC